uniref:Uncharacterized protein n=1 Tax=Salix viminalis TaxID=40686 RepID=A0A6N2LX20_SALVM
MVEHESNYTGVRPKSFIQQEERTFPPTDFSKKFAICRRGWLEAFIAGVSVYLLRATGCGGGIAKTAVTVLTVLKKTLSLLVKPYTDKSLQLCQSLMGPFSKWC